MEQSADALEPRGRLAAGRRWLRHLRERLVLSRGRYRSVDVAFEVSGRDVATGGAVLAGAIAFRLFLWTLPATVVMVALLGFSAESAGSEARSIGLRGTTEAAVSAAAREAQRGRWVLLLIGLLLLVSVSRTLAVTVHTSIALAWQMPVRKTGAYLPTAGLAMAVMSGNVVILGLTGWLRQRSVLLGITAVVLVVLVWTAVWWGISALLPHPPLPWWGLLPGAILVGVGMQVMHWAVVFYLTPNLSGRSALYGSLGTAATLLLAADILSRLVIWSAALNATIMDKREEWSQRGERA